MTTPIIDVTGSAPARTGGLEVTVNLSAPQSRLLVLVPAGKAGRAEAVVHGRSWAAKHYWEEEPGVMAYEFDEPLPAGAILVRVPFAP
jgi:hypothetical protein